MLLAVQDGLLDFISQQFYIEKDEINLEESLVDQGVIDSFGFVEMAAFLEEEFSIVVREEQITRDNFGSVVKIVKFIEGQASAQRRVSDSGIDHTAAVLADRPTASRDASVQ